MHALRTAAAVALALSTTFTCGTVTAQSYPARLVRIVVPFPPATGVDILARTIATPLASTWGQPVVVDNRAGAGGMVGSEFVAKAAPDGYTLLLSNVSTFAVVPALYDRKIPYDPIASFAPVILIATSAYVLVVHPSVPANSLRAFIALAKARPGQLNYGSAGTGTATHLAGELLRLTAGIDIVHVPYKGTPQATTDLLSGQTQFMFASQIVALPFIQSGKLRPLAMTGLQHAPALPGVPTMDESGLRGYEVTVWQGLVAPAGTPSAIVSQLNRQIAKILQAPEVRERLAAQGLDAVANSPEQFAAYLSAEVAKWAKVVRQAGVKPE